MNAYRSSDCTVPLSTVRLDPFGLGAALLEAAPDAVAHRDRHRERQRHTVPFVKQELRAVLLDKPLLGLRITSPTSSLPIAQEAVSWTHWRD
jgi:hypothetical protein